MRIAESVTFGGGGVDRAAHLRSLLPPDGALVLPLWRGKPLMDGDALAWLDSGQPGPSDVFLGRDAHATYFTRDLSDWEPQEVPTSVGAFLDPSEQVHPDFPGAFAELRARMTRLTPRDAELAATAKAVLGWNATHGFCARCGGPTEMAEAGWQRRCPACGARHFPRTDPVVIMLITQRKLRCSSVARPAGRRGSTPCSRASSSRARRWRRRSGERCWKRPASRSARSPISPPSRGRFQPRSCSAAGARRWSGRSRSIRSSWMTRAGLRGRMR